MLNFVMHDAVAVVVSNTFTPDLQSPSDYRYQIPNTRSVSGMTVLDQARRDFDGGGCVDTTMVSPTNEAF